MSIMPTFSPNLPSWRGSTSSSNMNENFSEILYDLNAIYEEASALVVELNDIESRIRNDVNALSSRMYSVSGVMTAYDQSASGYKMLFEDFYITKDITYPNTLSAEDRCVVNTNFGVITLPVNNSFSKVYTVNLSDGEITVAPDLSLNVIEIDESDSLRVDEGNTLNAFDGGDDTVWERKVRYNRDSTRSNVRCLMETTLPSMSSPYVNKLYIKPYPEGAIDIQSITYDTQISRDNVLPSFPTAGENNARSTLYSFDNIEPTKVKLYIRQRNSSLEDEYKTFVYGATEIGIEKVEYKSLGKVAIKFTLPDYETGLFNRITSLRTSPDYDNSMYKLYLYGTDEDFQSDSPIWTSSNAPITVTEQLDVFLYTTDSIWILIELTQESGSSHSPLLDSITMTYTTA